MPTIAITFPAGRYHATPWDAHVNEGRLEWPPSPWRLLRAFISVGFTTLGWLELPEDGRELIHSLAAELPSYKLPPTTGAHSRHYMPTSGLAKGQPKTTLVLDRWAKLSPEDTLLVQWPVELSEDAQSLLSQLVENLGYLGRGESWTSATLVSDEEFEQDPRLPLKPTELYGEATVQLMAPALPSSFAEWRRKIEDELDQRFSPEPGKKLTKKLLRDRAKAEALYPRDFVDAVMVSTADIQAQKWSAPPGMRRVYYKGSIAEPVLVAPIPKRTFHEADAEVALITLRHESGNMHALPHRYRTLPQAELYHQSFVAHLQHSVESDAERQLILGTGSVKTGHSHIHLLPVDSDGDGHLDAVLVWAPQRLSQGVLSALSRVRKTYAKGLPELLASYAGASEIDDLRRISPFWRRTLGHEDARVWRSVTPFIPPRYIKPRGNNTLEGQVAAELASRGLPKAEEVRVIPLSDCLELGFRHFVRSRRAGKRPVANTNQPFFAIELHFAEPIMTPLCLGRFSHFGLGMFEAAG